MKTYSNKEREVIVNTETLEEVFSVSQIRESTRDSGFTVRHDRKILEIIGTVGYFDSQPIFSFDR